MKRHKDMTLKDESPRSEVSNMLQEHSGETTGQEDPLEDSMATHSNILGLP